MQLPSRQTPYKLAPWRPMLPPPLREQALTVARHVFDQLEDIEHIAHIAQRAAQQSSIPTHWRATSLSLGFAGLAFAFAYCCQCFPEARYKQIAFQLATLVSQGTHTEPCGTPGFFEGTAGVATLLALLSKTDERYMPLAQMVNVKFQHVPYRGSAQVVTDLISKRLDFMVDPPTLLANLASEHALRALGVTGARRFFGLPDVPTISESGVAGYTVTSWQGLAAPAGMPASIVGRLNSEIAALLQEPSVIEQLRKVGNEPAPSSPDAFKARVAADIEKWVGVVASADIERI